MKISVVLNIGTGKGQHTSKAITFDDAVLGSRPHYSRILEKFTFIAMRTDWLFDFDYYLISLSRKFHTFKSRKDNERKKMAKQKRKAAFPCDKIVNKKAKRFEYCSEMIRHSQICPR